MKKFFALFLVLFSPISVFAAGEISIVDTSGQVRFVTSVEQASSLDFTVANKDGTTPSKSVIKLTGKSTGEIYEMNAVDGVASFTNLPADSYILASEEGVVFVDIQASTLAVAGASVGSSLVLPVVGGVVGVGGATAIGISVAEANDDDDDSQPLSPSI